MIGVMKGTLNPLAMLAATGSSPQGVNFAVKTPYLQALLALAPAAACLPRQDPTPLTPAAAVDALGPAIVRIEVQ